MDLRRHKFRGHTWYLCVRKFFFSTPDPSSYGRWLEIVAHPTMHLLTVVYRLLIFRKFFCSPFHQRIWNEITHARYIFLCRVICKNEEYRVSLWFLQPFSLDITDFPCKVPVIPCKHLQCNSFPFPPTFICASIIMTWLQISR